MAHHPLLQTVLFALAFVLAGCAGKAKTEAATGPIVIRAAGATAPLLAYTKWIEAYKKVKPSVMIEYAPTGSGEGIRQLEEGKVDFAASDMPVDNAGMSKMKYTPLHFPSLVGAIVPAYNLPGIIELKFSGEVLAGIFSGRIRMWNDAALAKLNPGVALPSSKIVVLHRSDSSGSTYTFTNFLSQVDPRWKKQLGVGLQIKWPVGEAQAGNEALSKAIQSTPASIGYVELNYAVQQKLTYGAVRNAAGTFEKPDLEALGAAVQAASNLQKDFRISIANSDAAGAYPIATLTWLIVPSKIEDPVKLRELKAFLRWAYGEGQRIAMSTEYGVLQPPILDHIRDQIADIH